MRRAKGVLRIAARKSRGPRASTAATVSGKTIQRESPGERLVYGWNYSNYMENIEVLRKHQARVNSKGTTVVATTAAAKM